MMIFNKEVDFGFCRCVSILSLFIFAFSTKLVVGLQIRNQISSDVFTKAGDMTYSGIMRSRRSTVTSHRVCRKWNIHEECIKLTGLNFSQRLLDRLALNGDLKAMAEILNRKFNNIPSSSPFLKTDYLDNKQITFQDWLGWVQKDGFLCRTSNDCKWLDSQITCLDTDSIELDYGEAVFTTREVKSEWFGNKNKIRGACICAEGFVFDNETLNCFDHYGTLIQIIMGCSIVGIAFFVIILIKFTWFT